MPLFPVFSGSLPPAFCLLSSAYSRKAAKGRKGRPFGTPTSEGVVSYIFLYALCGSDYSVVTPWSHDCHSVVIRWTFNSPKK